MREFLTGRVAKWWLPERVEFIDEVPKTSVGKFDKKDLRARFAGEQAGSTRARRVKQLVLSDLHLGARSNTDLLRRAEMRESLLAALVDVDRLVLLGDVLEMRDGPAHEPLAAARALFEDLGRTLGPDREVVMVPGNHDHELIGPWLEARGACPAPRRSGSSRARAPEASPLAAGPGRVAGAHAAAHRLSGPVAARRRLRTTAITSTSTWRCRRSSA